MGNTMAEHSIGILLVLVMCIHYTETYGPYLGCFKDKVPRAMDVQEHDPDMTLSVCAQFCRRASPYTFFGTQYHTDCFCGEKYALYGRAPELECNTKCGGNSSQTCGGGWRNSVYEVCPARHWGPDCALRCHCSSSICTVNNGTCGSPCLAGWLGASCNISDCTDNNGGCSHTCHQNNSAKWCSCRSGYNLDADGKGCSDINECATDAHLCSAGTNFCANYDGGYSCSCPPGYGLQTDNHMCADINECATDAHLCSAGKNFCTNYDGGYSCSCPPGYGLQTDNHTCADINECATDAHLCSAGKNFCANYDGGYSCSCPPGYGLQTDNHTCADIDECIEGTHKCSDGFDFCHNIDGSYNCSCPDGHRLESDKHICADIDECSNEQHQCSAPIAYCNNTKGSYTCSCPDGYELRPDHHTCSDINECAEGPHNCSAGADFCYNTNGSYTCSCPDGDRLEPDSQTCAELLSANPPITQIVVPLILLIVVMVLTIVAVVLFRRGVFTRWWKSRAENVAAINPPDIINGVLRQEIEEESSMSNHVSCSNVGLRLLPGMKISSCDLEYHVELLSKHKGNGFKEEFQKILDDRRDTCDAARILAVKDKNKFANIHPYDHSRVVLDRDPDYINASYIKIDDQKEYIAAQGPQPIGTEEFWEMVWQEETRLIVMLTNPVEGGKIKCVVYWPEEGTTKYGRINITLVREEYMPDFVRRTLIIGLEGVEREIRQYHFTSWPDHSVPDTATGILKMLFKVRGEPNNEKLTIVHCSAGVGRTGTYIAIDQQLKQAETEGTLDVLACVDELRNSRMNMVQTVRQYGFIYTAILEATSTGRTSIPCASYLQAGRCKEVVLKAAKSHYKFLESTTGLPQEEQLSAGRSAENAPKNRSDKNIPQNAFRVHLCDDENDYINAAFVRGFAQEGEFIATQLPLENTREDFWRMVFDYNCKILLILESEETLQGEPFFLPEQISQSARHGNYMVRLTGETKGRSHTVLKLQLEKVDRDQANTTEESIYENTLTASELRERKTGVAQPLNIRVVKVIGSVTSQLLVDIFAKMQKWQGQGNRTPVLVVCIDGVSKCGLYIATSLLLNMMNHEQEVDVFYATRTIRKYRPEFITSEEQYCFLHQTAAEHLNTFETYSNFN